MFTVHIVVSCEISAVAENSSGVLQKCLRAALITEPLYIYFFFYFAVFTKTTVCACYALVSRLDAFVNERWYSPFHIPGRSGNRSRCVWGSPVLEADTHKETVLDI